MLLLRSLLFDLCLYGLMGVMGILCAPLAIASRDGAYWAMRSYCRIVLGLLDLLCGLKVDLRGPLPTGPVLVAAKHQSFLDILILMAHLPRPKFVMKAELRWVPVLGLYALRIGCAPVVRERRGAALARMVEDVGAASADPGQVVIYPQGTRVAPGVRAPWKSGAGLLYARLGLPCVPMATNAGVFWGRRSLLRRPGVAVVEFLPELPPGLPVREVLARIEAEAEAASDRLLAEAASDQRA